MTESVEGYTMRPVRVSTFVPGLPDEVFEFISETRNDPRWCPNVESVELVEGEGVAVGTRYRFHQHLDRPGGTRMQFDAELEVLELGDHAVVWQATDKFQSRRISLAVTPEGSGSRVTQVTTARFHRPPGLARWVYPSLARRTFKEQFTNLAALFESRPGA